MHCNPHRPGRPGRREEVASKPIHVIVPFGAGSAADVIPRIVLEQVPAQIGQPIVVENRAGAGSTTGSAVVAKAEPDGYTLLASSSAFSITPAIYPNCHTIRRRIWSAWPRSAGYRAC
jgi:tripartite-type tricarboxylate transporter receptor subunit TctC